MKKLFQDIASLLLAIGSAPGPASR